jgi:RNA polymerase sigma-70 factor (ECF subfamily)
MHAFEARRSVDQRIEAHRIEALVAKHRPWLVGEARRMCRTQADAEDLVQDTFIRFVETFGQLPVLPHEGACVKWLTVTLTHRFVDQCRRLRSRENATPELTAIAQEKELVEPEPESPPAYDRISDEQIIQAVEALGPATRAAYELHASGRSNLEISATLGIKPGAVGKRLHDARVKLRKMLKSLAPGDN